MVSVNYPKFLFDQIGSKGVATLTDYILNKKWTLPTGISWAAENKLIVLRSMIDERKLKLMRKGSVIDVKLSEKNKKYFLHESKRRAKYPPPISKPLSLKTVAKPLPSRELQRQRPKPRIRPARPRRAMRKKPALPSRPIIKKSFGVFVASFPVPRGKDWDKRWQNVSPERKIQLAEYLKKEMKGFSFDWAAGGKAGEPRVTNWSLLGLAVGDKRETKGLRDDFLREFFIASKRLVTPAAWKLDPKGAERYAINFAKKEVEGLLKGPSNATQMEDAASKLERLSKVGKLEHGLPKGFRSIDQVLRKLPSKSKVKEWWAQVSKMPIGNKVRQNVINAIETIYELKLDFRQLNFPDTLLGRQLNKKNSAYRKQLERTFQNAFVASFLESAYSLRSKGETFLSSRDFHRAAFIAHKVACVKLHRGMQRIETQMQAAAKKALQQPLARKKGPPKKLAVA